MYNYQSTQPKTYVYKCTHRDTGRFYIGYREANVKLNRTSDVDFPIYKSSSKSVSSQFVDFDWIIVAEFENGNDAYNFEQTLIHEHWGNVLLLNEHCCYNGQQFRRTSPPWNKGKVGLYTRTDATKEKIREKRKLQVMGVSPLNGKTFAEIHGNKSEEVAKRISIGLLNAGITRSEEFKENLRKPKEKLVCPHCGKTGGGGAMVQWHFDKCKQLKREYENEPHTINGIELESGLIVPKGLSKQLGDT
jgi:hypothetical protein